MNRNEEWEQLKKEYQEVKAPEDGVIKMQSAIRRAKMDKKRADRKKRIRNWGIGAAAVMAVALLPNTNENIAYAMGNLPIVGGLFKVITIREYNYDDGHNEADVKIPEIVPDDTTLQGNSEAAEQVNKSVKEYTEELIAKFESEMSEEGHKGLTVSNEVLTDTGDWFTLKVTATETQASGYEYHRFYNIDKKRQSVVELKDLFEEGADYQTVISEEIKKQMRAQMEEGSAMYFLDDDEIAAEENFDKIAADESFYLDAEGNLWIAFDEYEVGPGYIGSPVFQIPGEVIDAIRK